MRQLIIHGTIFPVKTSRAPRRGQALPAEPPIRDGAIVIEDDIIQAVGPTKDIVAQYPGVHAVWDAKGCAVLPGFVDCHTHLPFAAWRADEYRLRLAGKRYEEIAHARGGIVRSSQQLRQTPSDHVTSFVRALAGEMLMTGTTTMEMKSGYGLSVRDELRQLRLIQTLRKQVKQRIVSTGLFLHAPPPETSRSLWIDQVMHQLWPAAYDEGLLDAVDAFVEEGAFTPSEVRSLLVQASQHQLLTRLHADQLSRMGGTKMGLDLAVRGLDHLDYLAAEDLERLASSGTVAVLLPAATYSMKQTVRPPAREIIDAGGAVAIATDFNPGTAPISSIPLTMSLAVHLFDLTPEEALSAVTINAAYVLGLDQQIGSLEVGKQADVLILDTDELAMIPYRAGHNPVARVMVRGQWVVGEKGLGGV